MSKAGALWAWIITLYPISSFSTLLYALSNLYEWPTTAAPSSVAIMYMVWAAVGMKVVPRAIGPDLD